MRRPWQIWVMFTLCLSVVLAAMGWVSVKVLRLERSNVEAQQQAAYEETVRLALWRMDSAISPLIIEESARPYFEYNSFNPAGVVYAHAPNKWRGDELVPSQLLVDVPSNVLVHFNGEFVGGKGGYQISSPQVPTGQYLDVAVKNYAIDQDINANNDRLNTFVDNVSLDDIRDAIGVPGSDRQVPMQVAMANDSYSYGQQADAQVFTNSIVNWDQQQEDFPNPQGVNQSPVNQGKQNWMNPEQAQQMVAQQQDGRNLSEYSARMGQSTKVQQRIKGSKQQQQNIKNAFLNTANAKPGGKGPVGKGKVPPTPNQQVLPNIDEDIMRPLWVDDFLVLARDVRIDERSIIQGAWLDWNGIKGELLAEIRDLLPQAELIQVTLPRIGERSRMMAALPVKLIPGPSAVMVPVLEPPLRVPLIIAWFCLVTAAISVGILLIGAVSLSERRGEFVSAVTHEMRTPLTTFRMYTEMLSEGMIKDEEKQAHYLNTLSAEGNRLSHLVENVLSYARLERGRPGGNEETLSVSALVMRILERLGRRAEQADMTIEVVLPGDVESVRVKTDTQAVEQILFNLIDNACKYACGAEDKTIHLEMSRAGGRVAFRVRDYGPGIAAREARRLFRPFCKSAQHAAESAPGVGLGLALSRRLARQRGGELRLIATDEGACFELLLPSLRVLTEKPLHAASRSVPYS